jgi:hypothetical protein
LYVQWSTGINKLSSVCALCAQWSMGINKNLTFCKVSKAQSKVSKLSFPRATSTPASPHYPELALPAPRAVAIPSSAPLQCQTGDVGAAGSSPSPAGGGVAQGGGSVVDHTFGQL